ncbi:MAG: histidine phosphatase family protein [Caldilineaceae bacterium SB0661_bin_32]|uniref:Histidine phosphatase family protein n=1 Tax=Caldilineaceae bacterium SB0661_bin_32 TaxID=2605255 RepID=A0A6B1D7J1_9CHLR|nr:histidine phosphatase family protein [Caldilineaceae bacterium SB0661_bin_32]
MKATEIGRPKKLYLIAHACTRQVPDTDAAHWQLNELGRQQAAALARQPFWDEVDRLLLSCEPKTRLTVAPLLKSNDLPVDEDGRFNELQRSPEWTNDYTARVAEVFRRPRDSVAGWEPAADALSRFRAGIDDWAARHPHDTLALVGHGLTFSLYRAHLLGLPTVPLQDWQQLSFAAVACVRDGRIVDDFAVPPGVPHIPRGAASPAVEPEDEQLDSGLNDQGRPSAVPE